MVPGKPLSRSSRLATVTCQQQYKEKRFLPLVDRNRASHRHVRDMALREILIMAMILVALIVLLFAALPTWPYTASGRARYDRP